MAVLYECRKVNFFIFIFSKFRSPSGARDACNFQTPWGTIYGKSDLFTELGSHLQAISSSRQGQSLGTKDCHTILQCSSVASPEASTRLQQPQDWNIQNLKINSLWPRDIIWHQGP